jgi:hypothetical protein
LNDADRNLNTLAKETLTRATSGSFVVQVVATIGTAVKTGNLTVIETGLNTGQFIGSIAVAIGATAAVSGNGTTVLVFTVPVGSTASFVVTYTDPVSVTTGWASEARFSLTRTAATVAFSPTEYLPGTSLPSIIIVTEPDANDNPLAIEILTIANNTNSWLDITHAVSGRMVAKINITQTRGTTTINLLLSGLVGKQLVETGKNTGVFELRFDLQTDLAGSRTSGDTLTARYYDGFNKVTVTGTATVGGTLATIILDRTNLPMPIGTGSQVTIRVNVTDSDANVNQAAVDSVTVTLTVKNATNQSVLLNTSTSITLTLTETGSNTGVFTGTFSYNVTSDTGTVTVSTNPLWILNNVGSGNVRGRDMIGGKFTVSYAEPLALLGVVSATGTIMPSTAILAVSPSSVNLNGSVTVTLTEPDWNININSIDTVTVTVLRGTTVMGTLTLVETGVNTGVFTASKRAGAQSPLTGFAAGQTITVMYTDKATADSYYGTGISTTILYGASTILSNTAVLTLNAATYGPFSIVTVKVTDPDLILLSASQVKLALIKTGLQEVGSLAATTKLSNGTFVWSIQLMVPGVTTGGTINTALVDTITVYFTDNMTQTGVIGLILTGTANIQSVTGSIAVSPSAVLVGGFLTVTVTDVDQNRNPLVIESVTVKITTDSWPLGKNITLPETTAASGVFQAKAKIVSGLPATDKNEVRGTTGDTIVVLYVDRWNAAGARESVTVTALVGITKPPTQRVPASTPELVDSLGNPVTAPTVNTVTVIQATVTNNDTATHTFTFIVQIKDSSGVVVGINWIQSMTLAAGASAQPGISWTPTQPGVYIIEVYVWESIANPVAYSPVFTQTVTVV